MNAIADNEFTRALGALAKRIARPKGILCISAHWMTEGTWVTRMKQPKTIHDFRGFPDELFQVRYPAPGSPEMADALQARIKEPAIQADETSWGLDHGTWAVLRHMYPQADIPVVQLSLDLPKPGDYHLQLGTQLRALREQGILIVGSGNIVHNLRKISWEADAPPFDWALEFDQWAKEKIETRDFRALASQAEASEAGRLSIPTPDHYYPLLYVLGASEPSDALKFEFEGIQNASISMRCLSFG